MQAHHLNYIPSLLPWEYDLSHCITLCKGCHAREHDIIPPDSGWILVSIYDSGELDSNCYRPLDNKGKICGQAIRYIHTIYHPLYGYCDVGSECVQFLTEEDKKIVVKNKQIRSYLRNEYNNFFNSFNRRYFNPNTILYEYKNIKIYECLDNKKTYSYSIKKIPKIKNFNTIEECIETALIHARIIYYMRKNLLDEEEDYFAFLKLHIDNIKYKWHKTIEYDDDSFPY